MPVILDKYVEEGVKLGIWEITETFDELFPRVSLNSHEKKRLASFKNHNRKLEFLSVRALLQTLTSPTKRIIYNGTNKPFLEDHSFHISISHSFNYTSILLSKNKRVGIDLEYMSHRISKISHKFINAKEAITENPELKKYHLYIHWCAKEALYKICDKQNINFKENLIIGSFSPLAEGLIHGEVHNELLHEIFQLNYFKSNNYIVVYCSKK